MSHYLIIIRHSISQVDPKRHAEQWGLTPEGRARSLQLAHHLTNDNMQRIFTSHEFKAVETGNIIADALQITASIAPDLHETARSASTYLDQATFKAQVRAALSHPAEVIFGDESFQQACQRFEKQLKQLIQAYPDQTIGVVSHGRIMASYLGAISQQDAVAIWERLQMPAFAKLELPDLILQDIIYDLEELA